MPWNACMRIRVCMAPMISLIVTGGQTRADQASWRAAMECGIPTGAWMPLNFMTENGPDSLLGLLYGVKTLPTDRHATLWFGTMDFRRHSRSVRGLRRPVFLLSHPSIPPSDDRPYLDLSKIALSSCACVALSSLT